MFKKVLIANRGEIAVRIARACRELGISPVAVYSDPDRTALHVRFADEAIHLGPAPSAESYLSARKIITAALRTGAEAIHPGYGFLSENAGFVSQVEEAGLVLIGPPASAMRVMGSKITARKAAQAAGLPVVPGTTTPLASITEAEQAAGEIGYPVMLKAVAGGGGKGMRIVRSPHEIASAFSMASSEAASSFNDPAIYIEKLIDNPRHIEIQILGDQSGQVVHLGERECTLQRRHQKVMEECPSPVIDERLRARMGEAAISLARGTGYFGAGTVEFLVDSQMQFYFLEMNTRLQVEHPVTEMVFGRDIVHEQIRIASGQNLSFNQEDLVIRGSAIECRIYAEDPARGFLPSPGRVTRLVSPSGPGIREDTGIYEGWEVPVDYDPLLAKFCVWGENRRIAVSRLARALDEYVIEGISTSLPFFRAVVRDRDFRDGNFDTGYIDRLLGRDDLTRSGESDSASDLTDIAAIAAVLHTKAGSQRQAELRERTAESRWKLYGRRTRVRR